jgi:hypothetical protein
MRSAATGALIATFGTGGAIELSGGNYAIGAQNLVADPSGLFIPGIIGLGGEDIEKRALDTGEPVTTFGDGGSVTGITYMPPLVALAPPALFTLDSQDSLNGAAVTVTSRLLSTGELDTTFGDGGMFQLDPLVFIGTAQLATDSSGLYVWGTNYVDPLATGTYEALWYLEKHALDGQLVTAFGSNGVLTQDDSATKDDILQSAALDDTNVYAVGQYPSGSVNVGWWHVMAFDKTTGAQASTWPPGGLFCTGSLVASTPRAVVADAAHVFIVGVETSNTSGYRWRIERRQK